TQSFGVFLMKYLSKCIRLFNRCVWYYFQPDMAKDDAIAWAQMLHLITIKVGFGMWVK
ncbi:MAG: hypothetical protein RL711_1757, partial [Bacteroidota bacterium]